MGTDYWSGLLDWLRNEMLAAGNISPEDLELFMLTDEPEEAAEIIETFYRERALGPNF